jgi:GntR family transcriptional regulator
LTRVVFDRDGQGIQHLHALYRPDRFTFKIDLQRTGARGNRRWKPMPQSPAA